MLNNQPPQSYYDYVDWLHEVADSAEQGEEWTSCEWYGHEYTRPFGGDDEMYTTCLDCGEERAID